MTQRFLTWLDWLLPIEGVRYENDPDDPGGATKFGIDQRSHPKVNIKTLTRIQAAQIYFDETWNHLRCEELPLGVGEVVARIAMNCGEKHAVEWLQHFVGAKVDGDLGARTLAAVGRNNAVNVAGLLIARVERYYRSLAASKPRFAKYLKGWLNATAALRRFVAQLQTPNPRP